MIDFSSSNIRLWSRLGSCGAYGAAMNELAESDDNLIAITADLCTFSGLDRFKQNHPDKFYNVGIAEQNMIGVAAGMVNEGFNVFASTYASFAASRCLDQVRVNMGYMKLPIKLIGLTSGYSVGILGATHISIEDIAVMRSIPNICVICPSDSAQTIKAVLAAAKTAYPVYIRLGGTMSCPVVYPADFDYEIGRAIKVREGNDISIIACGSMVANSLKAAEILESRNVSASIIDMHTVKPIDKESILNCMNSRLIVTVEEHNVIGGLGSAVAEVLSGEKNSPQQLMIGINDTFFHAASYNTLISESGLSPEQIADTILNKLSN